MPLIANKHFGLWFGQSRKPGNQTRNASYMDLIAHVFIVSLVEAYCLRMRKLLKIQQGFSSSCSYWIKHGTWRPLCIIDDIYSQLYLLIYYFRDKKENMASDDETLEALQKVQNLRK